MLRQSAGSAKRHMARHSARGRGSRQPISNPASSSGESGTNRRRSAPRIDEAGWEAGASKCRRTGEPDPRCCVDGPIQGLVGLAGAFATVGIAVWVLSGTFTMTLVVPRASNSMWTW